jgi:hypothetical protein
MRDGPQRGNEEIILAWEHHVTTVLYVVLFPMLAINRVFRELCVMRRLSKWSSNMSNGPEKLNKDVIVVQLSTRVADSLRCVEYIINPL